MLRFGFLFCLLFLSHASAQIDVLKLRGNWKTSCSETQINDKQGYVIETYIFKVGNGYEMKRVWFKKNDCTSKPFETDNEKGSFQVGKENTNNGSNPKGTYEVEYVSNKGTDTGLLWINSDYSKLRVARGFGGTNINTMLNLFEFSKIK